MCITLTTPTGKRLLYLADTRHSGCRQGDSMATLSRKIARTAGFIELSLSSQASASRFSPRNTDNHIRLTHPVGASLTSFIASQSHLTSLRNPILSVPD